jgi:hypothetical protein
MGRPLWVIPNDDTAWYCLGLGPQPLQSGSCTISFWLPSHQLDPSVPQTQQQRTFLSLQWVGSPFSLGFQNMMWAIYLSRSTLKNTILQVLLRIWV